MSSAHFQMNIWKSRGENALPKDVELACSRLAGILIFSSVLFLLHYKTSVCNACCSVPAMTQETLIVYSLVALLVNSIQSSGLFALIIKVGLDITRSGQTAPVSSPFLHLLGITNQFSAIFLMSSGHPQSP